MRDKPIPSRILAIENWTSFSFALERLQLYSRFLPLHYKRAREFQQQIGQAQPVFSFDFKVQNKFFPDIPPLSVQERILYMQSPLMEWEIYWESLYKSIYIIKYISSFPPISNARAIYDKNVIYLKILEEPRHTFAHFVERLPAVEDRKGKKKTIGISFNEKRYSFQDSTWSTDEEELNKFMSICADFISAAENDFALWAKANAKPNK